MIIEDFELPLPENYQEISDAADILFAELLIKYYMVKQGIDDKHVVKYKY